MYMDKVEIKILQGSVAIQKPRYAG